MTGVCFLKRASDKEGQGIVHSKTEFFSKTSPLQGASSQLPPPPPSSSSSSAPQNRPLPQPHLTGSESFSSNLLKATSPCSKTLASRSKLADSKGVFNAVSFNVSFNVSSNVSSNVSLNVNLNLSLERFRQEISRSLIATRFSRVYVTFQCSQRCP